MSGGENHWVCPQLKSTKQWSGQRVKLQESADAYQLQQMATGQVERTAQTPEFYKDHQAHFSTKMFSI